MGDKFDLTVSDPTQRVISLTHDFSKPALLIKNSQ